MILLLWLGCTTEPWCSASGTALHTTWSARWQSASCVPGRDRLAEVMGGIDARLSVWNDTSELHRLSGARAPVEVGAETAAVVRLALDVAEASGGAFDPTVEPLMVAWGFREGRADAPAPEVLARILPEVGWEAVEVSTGPTGTRVHPHGRHLDVSGVLEGHAADRLSRALSGLGHVSHLVQVGDEVRVEGVGPHGMWTVGTPDGRVLRVADVGVATAGVRGDGEAPSTLDPRTGALAHSDVRSVVVVAPTAAEADALATAVRVTGVEAGMALLGRRLDVDGLIVPMHG
ncbi:MAG: FAD:protein FMN transferase, partial [Myxococcales bacterium]|nr:FAD:protein FMN transferase [Myxococcales bacterium]